MELHERIAAFSNLGKRIKDLTTDEIEQLYIQASNQNPWFTLPNIQKALKGITEYLDLEQLQAWIASYNIQDQRLRVGTILAGNIPLVGFHDILSILISGNRAVIKLSSKDSSLMNFIINELCTIEPAFKTQVEIVDQLKDIDAIIATGSDNSARYFDYYFSKYPHIIRKNRTSVAVLTGEESVNDIKSLGEDIFTYFGLGCRNVSKIFIPNTFDISHLLDNLEVYNEVSQHHKYFNNYEYNKSIYLVNGVKHYDNGFLLLKEDDTTVSPISVLFYEYYDHRETVVTQLEKIQPKIQCIVSKDGWFKNSLPLGKAQFPSLTDYADGVDTMAFLTKL